MIFTSPHASAERQAFYERIDKESLTPLWEVLGSLVPPRPATPCVPALWRYAQLRPWLMEAGQLITAHEADIRIAANQEH